MNWITEPPCTLKNRKLSTTLMFVDFSVESLALKLLRVDVLMFLLSCCTAAWKNKQKNCGRYPTRPILLIEWISIYYHCLQQQKIGTKWKEGIVETQYLPLQLCFMPSISQKLWALLSPLDDNVLHWKKNLSHIHNKQLTTICPGGKTLVYRWCIITYYAI